MTFREQLEKFLRLRAKAILMSNGATADTTRDVLHPGGNDKGATPPRANGAMAIELEESFGRFVEVWNRRIEDEIHAGPNPVARGDVKSKARRAETTAILAEEGKDPTEVAFMYRKTTEAIKKARARAGRDPETGYKPDEKPLTATPNDQYRLYLGKM